MDGRRNTRPHRAGEWIIWDVTRKHTKPATWAIALAYVGAMIGIVNAI